MARVKRLARSRAQDAGPAHGECSLFSSLGQKGDFSPCPPPLALGSAQPRDNQGDFRAQPDGRSQAGGRAGRPQGPQWDTRGEPRPAGPFLRPSASPTVRNASFLTTRRRHADVRKMETKIS